jgi:hypothetical protein
MSTPGELLEALARQARARLAGDAGATRTYRGRSVDELIPLIQRELGADAIVVRRREGLTGGVLGFFQHPFVEIEAMPGAPSVDIYDEADSASPPPLTQSVPAAPAALAVPAAPAMPGPDLPAAPAMPGPDLPAAPAMPAAPTAPPGPAAPALPPLFYGRYGGRNPGDAVQPAVGDDPVAPPTGSGSAYVTAHLAALARADRSKLGRANPLDPLGPRVVRNDPVVPAERSNIGQRPGRATGSSPTAGAAESSPWSNDFQEILPGDVSELFPLPAQPPPASSAVRAAAPERREVGPGSHARARAGVARSLQRYGISEELAHELIDGASAHAIALSPRAGMAQAVRTTLAQRIPVAPSLPTKGAAIVVVGAGGAGKTTCCAALLGAYRKSSSLPASFATIAREAEREELRMILSPYIVKPTPARTPRALRALRRARSDGMAVLDTPNLSPSNRAGIRELATLLAELKPERVVVALPATLSAAAAAQLLQALRPLGANSLAVTHADETDQIGVAVEAACRFGLAPEYLLDRGRSGGWRLSRLDPAGLAARLLQ